MTYSLMNALFVFLFCFSSLFSNDYSGWAHLELGAGNYGKDGHTKASQAMTVLMKFKSVSEAPNYIDTLEDVGHGDYKPEEQYGILFWTLDQLVDRYGDVGIFHVNDLYEEYAVFAREKLEEYAATKGYHSVVIESIPGDYQQIDAQQCLSKYGKTKYTSAHLKNPEVPFYYDRMDGDNFFTTEESREETRLMLQNLANLSESGLYLFILYHDFFIPIEEKVDFMERGVFYHPTTEWNAVPYIFPEGHISRAMGKVFLVEPRSR